MKCESAFQKELDSCHKKFPTALGFVCLPLKIDFICGYENLFANIANVCDPSGVVDANFGEDYKRLKEMSSGYLSQYGNVSIDVERTDPRDIKIVKSISRTSDEIAIELKKKKRFVDHLIGVFLNLMILVYLKMIYGNFAFYCSGSQLNSLLSINRCDSIPRQILERN